MATDTPMQLGMIGLGRMGANLVRRLMADGGWPAFAQGATIEPGMSDRRVPALIARLTAEGDLTQEAGARLKAQGLVYGSELQNAVKGFQARHGLGADGRIGAGTQRSLSASAQDRARQIALNLERRRWLKREVAPERIEVNTAAAIMVYWKDGKPVHSNRVIVGTPANQTPSLEKPFASVVANPPWTVPMGIARREILPKGVSFDALAQEKINLAMSHVNAYIRQSQSDRTPYDVFEFIRGEGVAGKLHIAKIDPRAVCLKPHLVDIEMK